MSLAPPAPGHQAGSAELLAVLFSPSGVYAATPRLLDQYQLAEFVATVAELIKAQRRKGL